MEDTDGDDQADRETILLHGFGSEDCHHAIHNFVWGPGGGLYMQESVFHHTQIETIHGPRRSQDNAIYRFDPRTRRLDIVSRLPPGGNPWGYAINRWGEHLYVARHHNASLINQPETDNVANARYGNRDNRNCGQEFISSRHWPDDFQGKVFSNQYKNFQGVLLHDWTENGTTFKHDRLGKVFEAHNKACIPVDLQLGPEGALYVADWYNPVLGHMQYSLRDERRDSSKGRIWRITWKDRPLDTPAKIVGASVTQLLDLLKAYENRTRYRARRALWDLPQTPSNPRSPNGSAPSTPLIPITRIISPKPSGSINNAAGSTPASSKPSPPTPTTAPVPPPLISSAIGAKTSPVPIPTSDVSPTTHTPKSGLKPSSPPPGQIPPSPSTSLNTSTITLKTTISSSLLTMPAKPSPPRSRATPWPSQPKN